LTGTGNELTSLAHGCVDAMTSTLHIEGCCKKVLSHIFVILRKSGLNFSRANCKSTTDAA